MFKPEELGALRITQMNMSVGSRSHEFGGGLMRVEYQAILTHGGPVKGTFEFSSIQTLAGPRATATIEKVKKKLKEKKDQINFKEELKKV